MPWLACESRRIHYELTGPADAPVCVLVNGLTQYIKLWMPLRDALVARGFQVASYDMLGQGQSDKPRLFIEQADQVAVLRDLIAELGPRPVFVGGISFGGVIALRYAIEYPDTIAGLVPMSSFAEIPPQLYRIGVALHTALILGGTTYLQDLLFPMNFSNAWLEAKADLIGLATYRGWLINDVYALQNLMESFLNFTPLTDKLPLIRAPTLILTGEYDFLTPRPLQDSLRIHIPDSALVIIPRAYHAFTLERAELTAYLVAQFAQDVLHGRFHGKQSIWIGPDDVGGELTPFPEGFDHLRALPVRLPGRRRASRRRPNDHVSRPAGRGRPYSRATADPRLGVFDIGARGAGASAWEPVTGQPAARLAARAALPVLPGDGDGFVVDAGDDLGPRSAAHVSDLAVGDGLAAETDAGDDRRLQRPACGYGRARSRAARRPPAGGVAPGRRRSFRSLCAGDAAGRVRKRTVVAGADRLSQGA
jgi:3-oxoadipate enol-lactonase